MAALVRRLMVFAIFTDSSSSSCARNAKGCVCTGSCCPVKGAAFEPVLSHKIIELLSASAFPYPTTHPPTANSLPVPAPSNPARARSNHKLAATKPAALRDTCSAPRAAAYRCPPAKQLRETRQPPRPPAVSNKSAQENLSAQRWAKAKSSANARVAYPRDPLANQPRAICPRRRSRLALPAPATPSPLPSRSPQSAPPRSAPADQRNHIPTPKHPTARFVSIVPSHAPDPVPMAPPPETRTPSR